MMTEEEQMEVALAVSLGQGPSRETTPVTEPFVPEPAPVVPVEPPSLFASIIPSDVPEPAPSPNITRIQFRFPDGGRPLVRRFNKSDTIRDIFAFVKGLRNDAQEFELVFVGRRLLAEAEEAGGGTLEKSIAEAGLANGSLTVEV
jgi:UBX domain-containing protein 7